MNAGGRPDQRPLVSICIPAYARPRELRQAIDSVLIQEPGDLEVVVGDDSGDLEPVVQAVGDDRVVYVRNERRLGMAGNWNAVLDRSRGRFVGLLMDDDRLLPGFLRAVVDRFDDDPGLGVVCTNHAFDDGRRIWTRRCRMPAGRQEASPFLLLRHRPMAVSASVMRRQVWQAVRPLPDLLTADVVLHVRTVLAGYPYYYVDEPLMVYRVHAGQQSATAERFRHDQVAALELFSFEEAEAERIRRRYLARALVAVAASELREGEVTRAREELRRARHLGPTAIGARGMALALAAEAPATLLPLVRLWDGRPRRGGGRPGGP